MGKKSQSSYKKLMNSLNDDSQVRQLTDEELRQLKATLCAAYKDLEDCCDKYGLTVMVIGGSALGAVRHKGFIPWDDDLDLAMPREDFEKLKPVFDKELGDKYILSSPNYKNNARYRFPMVMIKGTRMNMVGAEGTGDDSRIKLDIFLIDNVPEGKLHRLLKGYYCTALMLISRCEDIYEKNDRSLRRYMCRTKEGKRSYTRRYALGKLFSFKSSQEWLNLVDKSFQYKKKTSLMSIPSGRGHYFGEIRPRGTFLPAATGEFEGRKVKVPHMVKDYLSNLYGSDFMQLPPEDKREKHFITDISFNEE